ncbi:MAG: phosphatidylglycerophosphatase A [Pseudorhodobacter sp.]|nr:phosphatidylglycerophosphatase A [Pseudorhodobacter sp.]
MSLSRMVAIFFGAGLLRPAPGTWGSAVALALGLVLHGIGGFPLLAAATLAATGWGFWALERELAGRPGDDPSEFVIDEVAGQWLALCFPSAGFWLMGLDSWHFPYPGWVGAFVFFRLFDIWKPGVIGRADRRSDAAGVMLDDLWAGLFAGIATMVAAGLAHGFLL